MFEEPNLPEIDVERIIRDAGDSESLVRSLVTAGEHSEDIHNTIKRNTDHLEIILSKPKIQESGSPRLVDFQEAVDLGIAFISE